MHMVIGGGKGCNKNIGVTRGHLDIIPRFQIYTVARSGILTGEVFIHLTAKSSTPHPGPPAPPYVVLSHALTDNLRHVLSKTMIRSCE